jgi:hypothetical protein
MNTEEFTKLKLRLRNYNFKFDDDILFKTLEPYEAEIIDKIFEDIVLNTEKLHGLNITFEIKEGLKTKKINNPNRLFITQNCEICSNTGFITMINTEKYDYSFLCNCSAGNIKKEFNPTMVQWNGKIEQFLKSEKYVLHDSHKCMLPMAQQNQRGKNESNRL